MRLLNGVGIVKNARVVYVVVFLGAPWFAAAVLPLFSTTKEALDYVLNVCFCFIKILRLIQC